MRTLQLSALLAIPLLVGYACKDDPSDPSSCSPACDEAHTCKSGRCVLRDEEPKPDADLIIIGGRDAGADDGGTEGADVGIEQCAAETTTARQLPLDIYIMLDQSGSMMTFHNGEMGWKSVTSALESFFDQDMTHVSIGLQYFGQPPDGITCYVSYCETDAQCSGCGTCEYDSRYGASFCTGYDEDYNSVDEDSCTVSDYATPEVEIAALDAPQRTALKGSIAAHYPATNTPTSAALEGAISHARSWAGAHADHVVIALLATDGEPVGCDENLEHINAIARNGLQGSPSVMTFVIGVGSSLTSLNGIAAAGGTGEAFIVDTASDITAQFLEALNDIRGAALGCEYTIPAPTSGTLDYAKVNVQYTAGGSSSPVTFPKVGSASQCPASGNAWYYDDEAAPQRIMLCDSTCSMVKANRSGTVSIALGCATIIN
ncbi:MAG: VWA domain-containing protein [Deltaproteobacteria bacterium]|nr:VWA domain-containing protein [Deltaproteobacteria bacterium]